MTFKTDYGMYVAGQNQSQGTLHTFSPVVLDHIFVVDGELFSTLVDAVHDGVEHAVALNFGPEAFGKLVAVAPALVRDQIRTSLRGITRVPCTIEFSRPVTCRIEATLGERRTGRGGDFVPFVVKTVATAGPAAARGE